MNAVKNALTRKFGPLPAWGWFLIAAGALFLYRSRQRAATSAQDQAQADAANPAYYGPYGQDNYPINGGAYTGGGGAPSSNTTTTSPPAIIVNYPGGGSKGDMKRKRKRKAQHQVEPAKPPKNASEHIHPPRSAGTTHNGRTTPLGSGRPRPTSIHPLPRGSGPGHQPHPNPTTQFHGGPRKRTSR